MNKRKGFRLLTVLALCMVLVSSFSMTAFAYADDTDQNLPITEATQPEDMPDTTEPEDTSSELPEGELSTMKVMPIPVIFSMTRQPISSSSPFRRKAEIPSTLSLTMMLP